MCVCVCVYVCVRVINVDEGFEVLTAVVLKNPF
jgi:hypothetical protein